MSSCVTSRQSLGPIVSPCRAFRPSIPLTSTAVTAGQTSAQTGSAASTWTTETLFFRRKGYRYPYSGPRFGEGEGPYGQLGEEIANARSQKQEAPRCRCRIDARTGGRR